MTSLEKKFLCAALWMREHRIERCDKMPHDEAIRHLARLSREDSHFFKPPTKKEPLKWTDLSL